jgi:hypothetical protein
MAEEDNSSKNRREETMVKSEADIHEYREKGDIVKDNDNNKSNNKIREDLIKG